jgi:internalin A
MRFRFLAALLGFAVFSAVPAVAELGWVEGVGGTITRDAAGRVTGVNLRGRWIADVDMRELAQLPYLTHLDLSLTRVTDQGMLELKNAPNIVDLNLRYAELVTDEGMAALKGWKKLKHLDARGAKISDTTLEHISGIATLESVDVGFAMITDVGIERLTSLPNLKRLSIGGNEMGDAGLQALRQMPSLQYLDLSGMQGTDSNLWAVNMTDAGLDALLTLKGLRELRLSCGGVGVGIEGQRFATVSSMNVTARWLEKMKVLTKLERIKLQGCEKVGDDAVASLSTMPALREIDLKGTAVTDKGVAVLRGAKPKAVIYSGALVMQSASFRNN